MDTKYDFSGWATKNDLRCSDGRIIRINAFKDNDGKIVPLVWNHNHDDPFNVLGHALLENRDEGVYAYCTLNDTESGQAAKQIIEHGDVCALSIYANKLKQSGSDVLHGVIREVSLVLSGANPGAFIDTVMQHGEDVESEAVIYTGEDLVIFHSNDEEDAGPKEQNETEEIEHSDDKDDDMSSVGAKAKTETKTKTAEDVFNTLTDEQKEAVYAILDAVMKEAGIDIDEESGEIVKHNVFEDYGDAKETNDVICHSDQIEILELAKNRSVGTFKNAMQIYGEDHLEHGFSDTDLEQLFPEYELARPGAPELVTYNQEWVNDLLAKVSKSPFSRIRMRHVDLRDSDIRALGYTKADEKKLINQMSLLSRTFDPQTVYVKDSLDRDDIVDITDFDIVNYQMQVLRIALNEEIALAALVGDGRETTDQYKIKEAHIQPVWTDADIYTIHADVDVEAAKTELQGTDTSANFGENYIYAEAIISSALYAREKYKGSGNLSFYCTPHLLNVMLLARDLNGRRIYTSENDLAAALNVAAIKTVEQFEGKTRTTDDGDTKKLLGLFVNPADYTFGSTRGGEISSFNDFDIDFNQHKYLMETRLSGALTRPFSAIALEEPVTTTEG